MFNTEIKKKAFMRHSSEKHSAGGSLHSLSLLGLDVFPRMLHLQVSPARERDAMGITGLMTKTFPL